MAQKPICKIAIQGCLQLIELFNFSLCIINLGFIYLIAGLRRRRSIQVGNQSLGIGECSYLSLDKPQGKGLYILLFDRFLGTNGGIVADKLSLLVVLLAYLNKWYHVPIGRELTEDEQKRIVRLLMAWIERQLAMGAK